MCTRAEIPSHYTVAASAENDIKRWTDNLGLLAKVGQVLGLTLGERMRLVKAVQGVQIFRAAKGGNVQLDQGDLAGALAKYGQAKSIRAATGTLDTPDDASLLNMIGLVKFRQGDLVGALAEFRQAKSIRTATGTLDTPYGKVLLKNIKIVEAKGFCAFG